MGARFHGMEEVKGSNPFRSTNLYPGPPLELIANTQNEVFKLFFLRLPPEIM